MYSYITALYVCVYSLYICTCIYISSIIVFYVCQIYSMCKGNTKLSKVHVKISFVCLWMVNFRRIMASLSCFKHHKVHIHQPDEQQPIHFRE